jgi:2-polyprenyl-3-methyl-5-hydroxy-6-metoxy-1,4-benzoquinol methylase
MNLLVSDFSEPWNFVCNLPLGWCQKPAQDTLRMFDQNPKTDPKSTPYYKVSVGMVTSKRWWHGALTAADCVKRTLYLITLRKSIEKEGIKGAITIKIRGDGKIFVQDGYHRLFCADYIGYKKAIPVALANVDPKFKAIESLMLKLGSGKNTYHPIGHPYFRGWNVWRGDTPGRFNAILAKLAGDKTVLDIGACEGYFTINLAARGYDVTAIEANPDRAKVLKFFADIREVRPELIIEDWAGYCARSEKEFDAIIFLSTFHHQVIARGLGEFEKLGLLKGKKLFFEMATNREPKMAKFPHLDNHEMVKLVLANTKFTHWEQIYSGPSPFRRDIFMFAK